MHLNHEKTEVWCHACLEWHDILTETLWYPRDNDDRIDIVCGNHPEVHLGYDDDLEKNS
jgi:hypothetical protein